MDTKPNLFIVGAMRAGTTTFYKGLSTHINIYASPIKETNFFSKSLPSNLYAPQPFFSLEQYFKKTFPAYLHFAHVTSNEDYKKLFSESQPYQKYLMEASPIYLHNPESAKMIKEYNPNSKIIIILRNPIDRMVSHYRMDLGLGKQLKDFNTLVASEIELYHQGRLPWHSYLGISLYNDAVARFQTLFDDVLVLKFEELISNPENLNVQLEQFLNIKVNFTTNLKWANSSYNIQYRKLLFWGRQMKVLALLPKFLPTKFRHVIFKKVFVKKEAKNLMSIEIKDALEEIFKRESFI
ncbi:MAG: sulfotransferase [Flavobacteriaceae bacterium]